VRLLWTSLASQLCPNNWVPLRPPASRRVPRPRLSGVVTRTDWDTESRRGIWREPANLLVMRRSSVRVRPQAPGSEGIFDLLGAFERFIPPAIPTLPANWAALSTTSPSTSTGRTPLEHAAQPRCPFARAGPGRCLASSLSPRHIEARFGSCRLLAGGGRRGQATIEPGAVVGRRAFRLPRFRPAAAEISG
jgi:hypothetical protein